MKQNKALNLKFNFSSENLRSPTVTVQRPPLSPFPVAPAITLAINFTPIHILHPSDVNPPPFQLPFLPLSKTGK